MKRWSLSLYNIMPYALVGFYNQMGSCISISERMERVDSLDGSTVVSRVHRSRDSLRSGTAKSHL